MKIPIPSQDEAKFAMAPMIDMVFLLLVFFMCASKMSQDQSIELEIPDATHAIVPKERPDRYIVNIRADGNYFCGNQPVADVDEMAQLVGEAYEANPRLKIYVRADEETEHKHVRKVVKALAAVGIDDYIFGAFIPD